MAKNRAQRRAEGKRKKPPQRVRVMSTHGKAPTLLMTDETGKVHRLKGELVEGPLPDGVGPQPTVEPRKKRDGPAVRETDWGPCTYCSDEIVGGVAFIDGQRFHGGPCADAWRAGKRP